MVSRFFFLLYIAKTSPKEILNGLPFCKIKSQEKSVPIKKLRYLRQKKNDFWLFAEASYIFSSSKIHQRTNHNSWNQVKQSLPRFFWKLKGPNFSSKALPSFILPYGIRFSNFNLYWGLSVINRRPHLQITGGYSFSTFPSAHLFT